MIAGNKSLKSTDSKAFVKNRNNEIEQLKIETERKNREKQEMIELKEKTKTESREKEVEKKMIVEAEKRKEKEEKERKAARKVLEDIERKEHSLKLDKEKEELKKVEFLNKIERENEVERDLKKIKVEKERNDLKKIYQMKSENFDKIKKENDEIMILISGASYKSLFKTKYKFIAQFLPQKL